MEGYKDGYAKGSANAEAGKGRDFRPATVKEAVKMVVSESYRKTHSEGVRDGYRDTKMKS